MMHGLVDGLQQGACADSAPLVEHSRPSVGMEIEACFVLPMREAVALLLVGILDYGDRCAGGWVALTEWQCESES